MAGSSEIEQAALNNAIWCDTVCRAHNSPGMFEEATWINAGFTPMFYPNVITLGGAEQAASHQRRVSELTKAGMPNGWTIKDRFQVLELAPLGFKRLFEARWIFMEQAPSAYGVGTRGTSWEVITSIIELSAWELAWGGSSSEMKIFPPMLLADENVVILAAYREGQIVAGAIANRAAGVVGISNVFIPKEEGQTLRRSCVAEAAHCFPGLPLVGYENGEELTEMLTIGFVELGPLSIWLNIEGGKDPLQNI